MRSSIGNKLKITVFGESHGQMVGIVVDNMPCGIKVNDELIKQCLIYRKPYGKISTPRIETDEYNIVSGIFNGYTTGAPLTIQILNTNVKSKDYSNIKDVLRPSHGDYTTRFKYHDYNDYRGGGHTSGRLTTGIVAFGAICKDMLSQKGIKIGSHILSIKDVKDTSFEQSILSSQIDECNSKTFSVLSNCKSDMVKLIEDAAKNNDSVGGILETAIINMPVGIGQPMFHSLESELSKMIFSVGGVKGVEFGLGFEFNNYYGSQVNDQFCISDDKIITSTNNNAGINAGISNGMPIIIKTVVKPTPSISKTQHTVNYQTKEESDLTISGRHDPCIVHRARIVIDSVIAIALTDMLLDEYGDDYFLCKKDC